MQQNSSASQQVLQATSLQNQIPVTRYISVVSGKTDSIKTVTGNIIKPVQSHQSLAPLRTVIIRGDLGDAGLSVHMKQDIVASTTDFRELYKATPSQQQPVHVQSTQQLYPGNSLQYVDSSGDHVYNNGSSANSFQYTDASHLYTNSQQQNNGVYFDSSTGSAHVGSQATVSSTQHNMNSLGISGSTGVGHQGISQLISSPGGSTYLIQGSGNEGGIVAMPITHNARASPATVQWLMEHFESAEGVSLPRALMYNHYMLHCREQSLDPVNAASYGKLVRSVFVGLRTRRLGTRGNSKYHYYGIRIKANSPLNRLHDDLSYLAMRQQPSNHTKRFKTMSSQSGDKSNDSSSSAMHASVNDQVQQQAQQHQQYLGDAAQALPDLDPIQYTDEDEVMPEGVTQDDLLTLEDLYRDHCANVLDFIVSLQFSMVEAIWKAFWRANMNPDDSPTETPPSEFEGKLPRQKLNLLSQWPPVQRWVKDSDHLMYQSLVEVLIPDVLRPIPSALTLAIRNFAKGLESRLSYVLGKCDLCPELIKIKLTAVSAFSQTLRRYTSLNHLAQAARAVMNDSSLTSQMLVDLNRVDFANVQEQASWVCQCEDTSVRDLESAFKSALSEQRTLEHWADWLEAVVTKVLKPHENTDRFTSAARQFLLKWCFYSSMVIRDLTLRSAVSFGSFHLIRLLYDEYMFYLVEHRVAQATGETAIAVMSEFSSQKTGIAPATDASPTSNTSDTSSTTSRSPAAFVASALISNSSSQTAKQTERGIKRSASEMEPRIFSVVHVNGKFPSVSGNTNKLNSTSSG